MPPPPPIPIINLPPSASNDSATTKEDTPTKINVLANDSDPNDDTLEVVSVSTPSKGTAVINSDNTITYSPNQNFAGTNSFTYTVSDGNGGSDTATVTVVVTAVNDPPVATNDSATTNEDTSVTINVLTNDSDVEGDTLSVASTSSPSNGAAAINPDNTITYSPNQNFSGSDSFTYTVSDGKGGSSTATVSITVTPVNDVPVATSDSATTPEDTPIKINVLANDSDIDGDTLSVTSTTTPSSGTATINADNTITYSPNQNFVGTDSFTYTISDSKGGTASATVTVTVTSVNAPPVATSDSATTSEDTPLTINVLANDSDIDGDTLSVTSTSSPSNGAAAINPDKTITYTPNPNFSGSDSFTYTVSDGKGGSDIATVTVTVSPTLPPPPVTATLTIKSADLSGATFQGMWVVLWQNGEIIKTGFTPLTVQINSNTQYAVTATNWKDIAFVHWEDGGTDSTRTFSVSQNATFTAFYKRGDVTPSTPPVASNDSATTKQNTPVTVNVLANDSDPDGNTLFIISTSTPSSGTATINANNTITYSPNPNFSSSDSFTYTISDGKGGTGTATVTVTITSANGAPIATDDSVERLESFAAQQLVDSLDSARFKQTIKDITDFGSRSQGSQNNTIVLGWLEGQLTAMGYDVNRHNYTFNGESRQSVYATKIGTINPDQMYIISAHMDTVFGTVGADDNGSGMSLLLEIARAFSNPSVKTDISVRFIFWNNEETNLAGSTAYVQDRAPLQGIESPLGSGLYPEPTWLGHITHDQLLYDHGIPPQQDQNPAADIDIEFRWDAAKASEASTLAKFIQSANSKYSVRYPAEVGPLMCCADTWPFRNHTASVTVRENQAFEITIHRSSLNDTPADVFSAYSDADFQLGFDTVRMSAGATADLVGATTPITINVLANDSDPDGDALSVISTSAPSKGTTTINADNTITYSPSQSFTGTDSFTYTISDGKGGITTSTITITINAINDPPAAADDSATTPEDTPVTINVLANDSDPDGDAILLDSFNTTAKFGGTITRDNNGTSQVLSDDTLVYTPPANGFGTDSFNYTISDAKGGFDTATVTITVTSVNDPPIANNDSTQTDMNTPVTINVLANDSDIDGASLTVTSTTTPTSGTTTINANNTITYSPSQSFTGTDSFTYTISDGRGGAATATVAITVFNPSANKSPTATNDSAATQEDVQVTISVLENDSDPDGDAILLDSFNTTAKFGGTITRDNNGTSQVLSDDTLVYTPPANGFGTDSFNYTISDAKGGFDTATVTITVTSVNDPPIAADDSATTPEDTPVTINVLANDSDIDGANLTVISITTPSSGSATINANNTITYLPNQGFSGTDSFTYTVSDGNGGTDTATITVTIQ